MVEEIKKIWAEHVKQEELIRVVCKKVGGVKLKGVIVALDKLSNQRTVVHLQERVDFFLTKSSKLEYKLKEQKKDSNFAFNKVNESMEVFERLKTISLIRAT